MRPQNHRIADFGFIAINSELEGDFLTEQPNKYGHSTELFNQCHKMLSA